MQYTRLWSALAVVIIGSFAVLGEVGMRAVTQAPPIPQQVVSADGRALFDRSAIQRGQGVWQSLGGQQIGSIWSHGAYVAPDWTADWLHREAVALLDRWARETGSRDFTALSGEQQAALQARLQAEMRTNTYEPATGRLRLSAARAEAFEALGLSQAEMFAQGRDAYAIPRGALTDPVKARDMATFFWWTAWGASTNRPGQEVTYTQNWPHEPLVGNTPTGNAVVWSVISFVLLLAGVGGMVWYLAAQERGPAHTEVPTHDPLLGCITP